MLWSKMFEKLRNQPLRITNHQHVHAIIGGERIDLDLKFNQKGEPYLVPHDEE